MTERLTELEFDMAAASHPDKGGPIGGYEEYLMEDGMSERLTDAELRELRELRAEIADVRNKNRELVTDNATLVAAALALALASVRGDA